MPQIVGSAVSGYTGVTKEYPVANGVTVSDGDIVYLASGRVTNASIGSAGALLGVVSGGQSTDPSNFGVSQQATGDSAGTVKVLVHVEPNAKIQVAASNGSLTAANVGATFTLTGSTGAQTVDAATAGTTGQLELVRFISSTLGEFIVNKHKYKVNA
jgi:hypothetical protein